MARVNERLADDRRNEGIGGNKIQRKTKRAASIEEAALLLLTAGWR